MAAEGSGGFARSPAGAVRAAKGDLGPIQALDDGLATAQADVEVMMRKMMDKITRRPQPSLAMPPKRPFASGCSPATGFQALAITTLGPGEDGSGKRRDGTPDLLSNPPYGSPAWDTAPKLFVTAWGRACECACVCSCLQPHSTACVHVCACARVLATAHTACP